jgi:hypothetical protein
MNPKLIQVFIGYKLTYIHKKYIFKRCGLLIEHFNHKLIILLVSYN